jgi:proprotein convertase subtilisin/kexin type 5
MSKLIIVTTLLASLLIISASQTIIVNYGCKSYSKDGQTCLLCSDRFYMDGTGICQPVSSSCKSYNSSTGACLTCYDGYFLADVICAFGSIASSNSDPYCLKVVNQTCTQCSKGFYLLNNTCLMVNPLCKSFDYTKLDCLICYSGYSLTSTGNCEISAVSSLAAGCSQFNNSVCIKCSNGYYFDSNKTCVLADTLCKSFDQSNGDCLSCYAGFKL